MNDLVRTKCLSTVLFVTAMLIVEIKSEEPLLLTPYIDSNNIQTARRLSTVDGGHVFDNITLPNSYAGFLTVNRTLGNHMFFWFFPAKNITGTPLLLWLNGGPTVSSMLGLLWEHGPVRCETSDGSTVKENGFSWIDFASVLYVDNPVGAGYSFSESGAVGERFMQEDITRELYSFLEQFFLMFSEYKDHEFYIGGQSFAGKYVPSLAHFLHEKRRNNDTDIPLTGIYLGGPLFDPPTQIPEMTDYLYSVGAVSYATHSTSKERLTNFIKSMNGEPSGLTLSQAVASFPWNGGIANWDSYVDQKRAGFWCARFVMTSPSVRRAVHVGTNQNYEVISPFLKEKFGDEFFFSTKPLLAELMDHYKVLVYSGDYDIIVSSSMTEAALLTTSWSLQLQYNNTERSVWYGDHRVLGYFSVTGQFCRVVVRAAGHQTPYDQPETSSLMMSMFIRDGCVHDIG